MQFYSAYISIKSIYLQNYIAYTQNSLKYIQNRSTYIAFRQKHAQKKQIKNLRWGSRRFVVGTELSC